MHEMSLAEGVLQIVEQAAREQGFARAKTVRLEIGELAGVEREALRFCFDAVVRGSIAEGCDLDFVDVPGAGWCMRCSVSVPVSERYAPCPHCGGYQIQVTGGAEMKVKDLLVD